MAAIPSAPLSMTSIIDNQEGNTLKNALEEISQHGKELCVATAFFSLDALNLTGAKLQDSAKVRLLFGDDAERKGRLQLLQAMRELSDADLQRTRESDPLLPGLHYVRKMIQEGRLEARCYTRQKFHAKAYLAHKEGRPPMEGILGSGNFTRPGLTQNIELNVHLTREQTVGLHEWFEARWLEAQADEVTADLLAEIERHIALVEPHALYLRALLLWGDWVQGREPLPEGRMLGVLDPHQIEGYRRALKVLARDDGVMVCDGVGLGKSFIALALMEHFIGKNKRVLLVAPKAILDSAWERYFKTYLPEKADDFSSVRGRSVDYFGRYAPREEGAAELALVESLRAKGENGEKRIAEREDFLQRLESLSKRADVVIVDESHNLRTPSAQRYLNALAMLHAPEGVRKKVVLLTATPLNTKHLDLTAQWGLIFGPEGSVGTRPLAELRKIASNLDREMRKDPERQLELDEEVPEDRLLIEALKRLAIQRSRAECKRIGEAAGKPLRFPKRSRPKVVGYELSPSYRDMVDEVEREFTRLSKMIRQYRDAVTAAKGKKGKDGTKVDLSGIKLPRQGIRLSAYLPNLYRKDEAATLREGQVESFLASLVFTNVMKQLESSPVAFQSILQSLGAGLCARLLKVFKDDPKVAELVDRHRAWINVKVRTFGEEAGYDDDPEAEGVVIAGDEADQDEDPAYLWRETQSDRVATALRSRAVRNGLVDFGAETHDVKAWRKDIESDLATLERIGETVRFARETGEDHKLDRIADTLRDEVSQGRKALVFTQSVRTAEYLEDVLPRRIKGATVRRIDANVYGPRRQRLLNAFSPKYNPAPYDQEPLPGVERLDILVCTDVLSEGVNLQEAGCILNYDLHWNPVRLIQRIGRVDRRLADDDPEHAFDIVNVFPPDELEKILKLVGTVEGRVAAISRVLGIDQSFFKTNDPEGTLREFDGMVDGTLAPDDDLLLAYNGLPRLDADAQARAEAVPPGAFGVWKGSGATGGVGVFTLKLHPSASEGDRERYRAQVGSPIMAMRRGKDWTVDPVEILTFLAATKPGEPSAETDLGEAGLRKLLRDLREEADESLSAKLPASVTLDLVCWMEFRL